MNIGILTLNPDVNYGGILQAWALQQVLKGMGHEVVTFKRVAWVFPGMGTFIRRLLIGAKNTVLSKLLRDRSKMPVDPLLHGWQYIMNENASLLQDFIDGTVATSRPIISSKSLARYVRRHRLSCLIVGSDQVWRTHYSPCITDYFLCFLPADSPVRKIAYGASFGITGHDIPSDLLPECIKSMRRFDAISVREESAKATLETVFRVSSRVVLDPTLLLCRQDYEKLTGCSDRKTGGFLFRFLLWGEDFERQIADDAAKALHNDVGLPQLTQYRAASDMGSGKISVPDWLSSFAGADFVVTNSYHGCVFSLIFNKPFIVIANKDRGIERLNTLLGHFGLQGRMVSSFEEYREKKDSLLAGIDYGPVNARKEQLAAQSLDFLRTALS